MAILCLVAGGVLAPFEETIPNARSIRLTAQDDMSVQDFNSAIDILKGRLDVFAGEGNYRLDVDEDSVMLSLPNDRFGDQGAENDLTFYLAWPVQLYLGNEESMTRYKTVPISRSDIASATIQQGSIDGVNPEDFGLGKNYQYVRLELTDEFASENAKAIEALGKSPYYLYQDIEEPGFQWWYAYPTDEKNVMDILVDEQQENCLETLVYDYTSEPLAGAFDYSIALPEDALQWETPGEGRATGENQVAVGEIDATAPVTVSYSMYAKDSQSEGDLLDMDTNLRNRLDALGQPYAVGTYDEQLKRNGRDVTNSYLVVRMSPERVCKAALEAIPENDATFFSGGRQAVFSQSSWDISASHDTGSWTVATKQKDKKDGGFYSKDQKKLIKHTKVGDEISVIESNRDVLLRGLLLSKGKRQFTVGELKLVDGSSADDDRNGWALSLFEATASKDTRILNLSYSSYLVTEDGMPARSQELGINDGAVTRQIEDEVRTIVPGADVEMENNVVNVDLHLPLDASLVEDGLSLSEIIYKKLGLNRPDFYEMHITLIDENLASGERADIYFRRWTNYAQYDVDGLFANGRVVAYQKEFKHALATKKFWRKFPKSNSGWRYSLEAIS